MCHTVSQTVQQIVCFPNSLSNINRYIFIVWPIILLLNRLNWWKFGVLPYFFTILSIRASNISLIKAFTLMLNLFGGSSKNWLVLTTTAWCYITLQWTLKTKTCTIPKRKLAFQRITCWLFTHMRTMPVHFRAAITRLIIWRGLWVISLGWPPHLFEPERKWRAKIKSADEIEEEAEMKHPTTCT